jgi:hypothetical protein
MEALVSKILGSTLKKFINGFNKEMLSLQIMKGTAQVKDFGTASMIPVKGEEASDQPLIYRN